MKLSSKEGLFHKLVGFCRLYTGKEEDINENPYNKMDDEFKWYMWRVEFVSVRDYDTNIENYNDYPEEDRAEEYMKAEIKGGIDMYADAWAGGDPTPHYENYFCCER